MCCLCSFNFTHKKRGDDALKAGKTAAAVERTFNSQDKREDKQK